MPFPDHYFSKHLIYPQTWTEIDFPSPYTGHLRIALPENNYEVITMSQLEKDYPEKFKEFCDPLFKTIGTLKNPKEDKNEPK